MKKLLLFTSSYPFGTNETFIEEEIIYLAKQYDQIEIYPFYYNNKITKARKVPYNVKYNIPIIPLKKYKRIIFFIRSVLKTTPIKYFIRELFFENVFLSKTRLKKWVFAFIDFCILWDSPFIKELNLEKNSVFYYYWGFNWAWSLCFLKKNDSNSYFVRLHGGEVYKERNKGYIPQVKCVLKKADYFLPISNQLKEYLISNYRLKEDLIFVSRLGTKFEGINPYEISDVFRFVSVSNLIPLKRVDLIIRVLSLIHDKNIEWYHFGDGFEMTKLKQLATNTLDKNIKWHFMGHVTRKTIFDFYTSVSIDAFINLSRYEGVPVSIMESSSVGIPAIATDVGATNEVVNNSIGALIDVNEKVETIAELLLSSKTSYWQNKRTLCFEHWKSKFNADKNYSLLLKIFEK